MIRFVARHANKKSLKYKANRMIYAYIKQTRAIITVLQSNIKLLKSVYVYNIYIVKKTIFIKTASVQVVNGEIMLLLEVRGASSSISSSAIIVLATTRAAIINEAKSTGKKKSGRASDYGHVTKACDH